MGNLEGFDATQVEPTVAWEPIPAGDYPAMMTVSEFTSTAKGDGSFLFVEFEVLDGEHKGKTVQDRLNLDNPNPKAVGIAKATLSAICHATGIMNPKDSTDFHDKPVMIKVIIEERNDKPGSYSNKIKGYSSMGAQRATPAAAKPAAQDAVVPPWKRK